MTNIINLFLKIRFGKDCSRFFKSVQSFPSLNILISSLTLNVDHDTSIDYVMSKAFKEIDTHKTRHAALADQIVKNLKEVLTFVSRDSYTSSTIVPDANGFDAMKQESLSKRIRDSLSVNRTSAKPYSTMASKVSSTWFEKGSTRCHVFRSRTCWKQIAIPLRFLFKFIRKT